MQHAQEPKAKEYEQEHLRFLQDSNPKMLADLRRSGSLSSYLSSVGDQANDRFSTNIDLFRHERHQSGGRPLADPHWPPGVAQVTEHQREAEPVVVAAAASDRGQIDLRQCIMTHEFALFGRRVIQRGELDLRQLLASRHDRLHGPLNPRANRYGRENRSGCSA